MRPRAVCVAALTIASVIVGGPAYAPNAGTTSTASRAADGRVADGWSRDVSIALHVDTLAFSSQATNLGPTDNNGLEDVYVMEFDSGSADRTFERISIGIHGSEADGPSRGPAISGWGAVVAFESTACNLVPAVQAQCASRPDMQPYRHVYVHNRRDGRTELVSATSSGTPAAGDSYDVTLASSVGFLPDGSLSGFVVAFESSAPDLAPRDRNNAVDVFRVEGDLDAQTGTRTLSVQLASHSGDDPANGASYNPHLSPDADFVAFASDATDLIPVDENGVSDVFLWSRRDGSIRRVSQSDQPRPGQLSLHPVGGNGRSFEPSVSADGLLVAFSSDADNLGPADINGLTDVYVFDRQQASIALISSGAGGVPADGASGDAQVFAGPLVTQDEILGYQQHDDLQSQLVAFVSHASNLLIPGSDTTDGNGAPDVYLYDLRSGLMERISVGSVGQESRSGEGSFRPSMSAYATDVAFTSESSTFAAGDPFNSDVFIRHRTICSAGLREWGPASDLIDDHEQYAWFAGRTVHNANCEIVVLAEQRLPVPVPDPDL